MSTTRDDILPEGKDAPVERRASGADPVKCRQILDGARRVFLDLGFDGASMGDIARAAGVSKGTLYVYFDNKAELFAALIAEERKHHKREFALDPDDPDIAGQLRPYFDTLLAFICGPRNIQSRRTVMAIAERFPKVGEEFYRDGPGRGIATLRTYLEAQAAAGRLAIEDSTAAAQQLLALVTAGTLNELLFGVREEPDADEISRNVKAAVDMFLARYATASPPIA